MSFQHAIQRVMSGDARGVGPAVLRAALAAVEPVYATAAAARNRKFDRDPSRVRRLPRPVVSVGNITTGGTGKTPVVRFLAGALRRRGLRVAILSRGYKAAPGTLGDEQRMLLAMLGGDGGSNGGLSPVTIEADPDRFAAGTRALARDPAIDLFLLDDAFQHRRLHRDLDVVLLHAGEPFGYGHVLPRGLLREPLAGLARAGVVVLTNCRDDAPGRARDERTVAEVRRWNPTCPVLRERHEPSGLRSAAVGSDAPPDVPVEALKTKRVFCVSGLGSPGGFESAIASLAGGVVGAERFPDHHAYTPADVARVRAKSAGADAIVTTEKDWVKLAELPEATQGTPPIWRLDVTARFDPGDGERLVEAVAGVVQARV
ncbi:MAG TPA: tetraacyldisaccharide 4'-kinase [Humisphaera sp.]